ncbi:chemotaxis protein CheX [Butyrivibrio sp. INlla21]|uniref:chemotaxis protein CheX n=1 Tax=Butyrivibrio sp. INlla21 TaxID=1520811 RepID=UPI0008E3E8A1|nr:chemotaxis protein CheX [Butyrivibrio sp. INlla21]SFU53717.1 Chemotaxis phosphatase CheX [Butyrivibrio sp. INlla21]
MFDRLIGVYLLEQGLLDKNQIAEAYRLQESNRAKLGVIAVSEKLMSIAQAEQVNAMQASMDKRFGDIAVERGYLSETQVSRLLELQGNSYLAFIQAIVDLGYLSMEKLREVEEDYQVLHGFTESDMSALKSGDVERIVPIFLATDDPVYRAMFSMGIKNMYRLVDNHIFVGKAYKVSTIKDEVLGVQKFHGDQKAVVAISGKYEDVQRMAIAYTKEEFIETKEDALDAICELINCINGLYATEQSRNDTRIELEPPNFYVSFPEASCEEIMVMPIYICGGEVKYLIAISKDIEVK